MTDGEIVRGESNIPGVRKRVERVCIEPEQAEAYDPAIAAILSADLIVLGPGSLYTSVLPNLLVQGIAHALRFAPGEKVYVCNVATQPGETDGYSVIDHLRALASHMDGLPVNRVLINSNLAPAETRIKPEWHVSAVRNDGLAEFSDSVVLDQRDIVNPEFPLRHDPEKLAEALISIGQNHVAHRSHRPVDVLRAGDMNGHERGHGVVSKDRAPRVPVETGRSTGG
jgi:uncharacterized cofD-like protein